MARPQPDASKLVRDAMDALGAATDAQFAHLLWRDYGIEAGQSKVSRWRRGMGAPNYEATVALLTITGELKAPAKARAGRARAAAEDGLSDLMHKALRNQEETRADIRALALAVERIAALVEAGARGEDERVQPRKRRPG